MPEGEEPLPSDHEMPRSVPARVLQALWRLRFTLLLLAALGVAAVITNTQLQLLSARTLEKIGFAPRDIFALDLWRAFTSALVTNGGATFYLALGSVALFVGAAEWLAGTGRTAATFWGMHLLTLVIESVFVALPLHLSGDPLGTALVAARDVGPSAGYFACLGLALMSLKMKPALRATAIVGMFAALVVAALFPVASAAEEVRELSAGIAHLIAFPLGVLAWRIGRRSAGRAG